MAGPENTDDDAVPGDPSRGPGGDRAGDRGRRCAVAATPEDAGQRLDRLIAAFLPELSRSRAKALIEAGQVSAAGATISEPSYRVKPGQSFAILIPEAEPALPRGQPIALAVVYEDSDVIVIDKPAGMVVHPAAGNPDRTLVNALIAHCGESLSGIGGVRRPGIVHRLDKDTSGLMVAAKTDAAHQTLAADLAARRVERTYQALVWGVPSPREGEIAGNIGRHPVDRKRMAVVSHGGKAALTRYRVIRAVGLAASLVECRLASGRTHQIRVHMAAAGHPVVGDPLYGRVTPARRAGLDPEGRRAVDGFRRQALHAWRLAFRHPRTGERLEWTSEPPSDMRDLLSILGRVAGRRET